MSLTLIKLLERGNALGGNSPFSSIVVSAKPRSNFIVFRHFEFFLVVVRKLGFMMRVMFILRVLKGCIFFRNVFVEESECIKSNISLELKAIFALLILEKPF